MSINDLIERLASDARPVQRHAFRTIIWPSLVMGALCGLVVMVISIGLRPGLEEADTMAQLMVRGGLGLGSAIARTCRTGAVAATGYGLFSIRRVEVKRF